MQSAFLKTLVILGLITGLAVPPAGILSAGFAAEEEFSTEGEKLVLKQEKTEAKAEKSVMKEEAKPTAAAAETLKVEPPKEEMASKSVTGEVAGISPRFIAVTYGQDAETAYEMALNLDEKIKIVGAKDLSEILVGDTVSVTYDERFQKDEKGNIRINGRKVNVVTLVRPGNRQLEERETAVAPLSEEEAQNEPQEGSQEQ